MKIIIEDDKGQRMSLETALTVIPSGYAVLICPADKDTFITGKGKYELETQLGDLGIRAVVVPTPVCVWAIADDARRAMEDGDAVAS